MSFIIAKKKEFWWPVTVVQPSDAAPGEMAESAFEARFEALPSEEALALGKTMRAADGVDGMVAAENAMIGRVVTGWRDVEDQDGKPIAFSPEALAAACRWAWFRAGVVKAYHKAMSGEEARLKN